MKLHLGVIDQPYAAPPELTTKGKRKKKQTGVTTTTGDVAEILEEKYGVMGHFADEFEDVIAMHLENSISGAIESMMMGAPLMQDPFASSYEDIQKDFRSFISSAEIEHLGIPGVPTAAALNGVNSRMKDKKGPRRPSFRDTGLYMNSMKAWMED